jgi:DNA-binding MarR family transcriptional regulator
MVLSTDTDIGILLGLAYAGFVDELRADLAARGFADLGPSYGYVFRVLGDGERSLSELAGLLGMTLPGAGKIVDEMEARGYVERHPDASDRRVKQLRLSPRGRAALKAAQAFHRRFERRLPDGPALRAALEGIATDAGGEPAPRYVRPL